MIWLALQPADPLTLQGL
ncbi:hypothetical protein CFP56_019938 [Quercus suber]|uniref:Uncharacterized protein n=1 Tax=Quercus suber TaxID=58331 RepID=A0AAW0KHH9_QUESU